MATTEEAPVKPVGQIKSGIVKTCLSGDCMVIRGRPRGGPPPEVTLALSSVTAPRIARRANPNIPADTGTEEEPFGWEAREFLRKKVVGKEVLFLEETTMPTRSYGTVYLPPDPSIKDITQCENITKTMISEGFLRVRETNRPTEEQMEYKVLSEDARTHQKGIHNEVDRSFHVRTVAWTVENPRHFVDSHHQKSLTAVVEQVVNGSTFRAFLLPSDVSPTYQYVTLLLSGVRAPSARLGEDKEPFEDEAKFFVESRLLQRDVQIILEGVSNNNIVGTVIHPNGNIAEILLKEGFARCVDWSMTMVSQGPEKYRTAEKVAKDSRKRLWKDFSPTGPTIDSKEKNFSGKVVEVVNSDSLVLKLGDGSYKKCFLASVRPPRLEAVAASEDSKGLRPAARSRPLYDIPYMFEAREFLRKKLIGKKVAVTLDYIQPAAENFPEKNACTVMLGGQNIAEALVSKGYCTVVRYRQDDDQRSSHYDELLAAESKAEKKALGLHSKKAPSALKVSDISGDATKAKQFLPFLQRAGRLEALVEFVASGSRVRVYIPRETCLITFLLSGISCPRAERVLPPPQEKIPGEPFGNQALTFTKEHVLQREVDIEVESMDKGGNFIGYLFTKEGNENLSELLVREGLASVHFTAEKGNYLRQLQTGEEKAKEKKLNIWQNYVPEDDKEPEIEGGEDKDDSAVPERKVNYQAVVITEVSRETLNFFAQFVDDGPKLEKLMEEVNQELTANPPLPGAYTPKRGELCAAKFEDGFWYRAKVEKSQPNSKTIPVYYVDYGNKAQVAVVDSVAALPARFSFANTPAFAHEYGLACIAVPADEEAKADAFRAIAEDVTSASQILLNPEYESNGIKMASILNASNKEDVAKGLISEGFLLVDKERKEKRLQKLLQEYRKGQESAKSQRLNLWRYGDFTDDDAREFGMTNPTRK